MSADKLEIGQHRLRKDREFNPQDYLKARLKIIDFIGDSVVCSEIGWKGNLTHKFYSKKYLRQHTVLVSDTIELLYG